MRVNVAEALLDVWILQCYTIISSPTTEEDVVRSYFHPKTRTMIKGMRLAPGAVVQDGDRYAADDGKWRSPGMATGQVLYRGCETIWVRPDVGLSPGAGELLVRLAEQKLLLARAPHWRTVSSPPSRHHEDPDRRIAHPECVQELFDYGLIRQVEEGLDVYQLTADGQSFARSINRGNIN